MSIILGALSGVADTWLKNDEMETKAKLERETHAANATVDSNNALNRAISLENFKNTLKVNVENQQRVAQVARIDDATGAIADKAIQAKRGGIVGGIVDQGSWTAEQQAAVDQSLGMDRNAILADPKTRVQAAISTGDISPEKAATLGQTADLAHMKMENLLARAEDRNATAREIAELRIEAAKTAAEMRKNGGEIGKEERLRYTSLFSEAGRRLGESQKSLATLQKQPMYSMAEKGSPQAQEMEDLRTSIKGYQDERRLYQGLLANSQTAPGSAARPATGPTTRGERDMKSAIDDENGNTAADYDREIAAVRADLADPRKPADAKADLRAHLEDMVSQRAKLDAPEPDTPARPAAAKPLALPVTKAALQVGKVYQTARGPAVWNGTAFEAR